MKSWNEFVLQSKARIMLEDLVIKSYRFSGNFYKDDKVKYISGMSRHACFKKLQTILDAMYQSLFEINQAIGLEGIASQASALTVLLMTEFPKVAPRDNLKANKEDKINRFNNYNFELMCSFMQYRDVVREVNHNYEKYCKAYSERKNRLLQEDVVCPQTPLTPPSFFAPKVMIGSASVRLLDIPESPRSEKNETPSEPLVKDVPSNFSVTCPTQPCYSLEQVKEMISNLLDARRLAKERESLREVEKKKVARTSSTSSIESRGSSSASLSFRP